MADLEQDYLRRSFVLPAWAVFCTGPTGGIHSWSSTIPLPQCMGCDLCLLPWYDSSYRDGLFCISYHRCCDFCLAPSAEARNHCYIGVLCAFCFLCYIALFRSGCPFHAWFGAQQYSFQCKIWHPIGCPYCGIHSNSGCILEIAEAPWLE